MSQTFDRVTKLYDRCHYVIREVVGRTDCREAVAIDGGLFLVVAMMLNGTFQAETHDHGRSIVGHGADPETAITNMLRMVIEYTMQRTVCMWPPVEQQHSTALAEVDVADGDNASRGPQTELPQLRTCQRCGNEAEMTYCGRCSAFICDDCGMWPCSGDGEDNHYGDRADD